MPSTPPRPSAATSSRGWAARPVPPHRGVPRDQGDPALTMPRTSRPWPAPSPRRGANLRRGGRGRGAGAGARGVGCRSRRPARRRGRRRPGWRRPRPVYRPARPAPWRSTCTGAGSSSATSRGRPPCRALAAASGATVVSVDYRLAPESPSRGRCTTAWPPSGGCVGRARGAAGAARRLAGGRPVAAVSTALREAGELLPDAQLLLYPTLAPPTDTPSMVQRATGRS